MTRSIDGIRAYMVSGLLAAGLLGCAWPARSQPPLDLLMDRIVQRNAIGDAVALLRDSGKPVLDQAREAAVLQSVRDQAPAHGLDADDAARFFGAQIEANKSVQYALLSHWHERGHAPNTTSGSQRAARSPGSTAGRTARCAGRCGLDAQRARLPGQHRACRCALRRAVAAGCAASCGTGARPGRFLPLIHSGNVSARPTRCHAVGAADNTCARSLGGDCSVLSAASWWMQSGVQIER